MKPNNLLITNIGPFVGKHSIDFTKLDNIYIITGKTGSGKTTILDCITYALYGKLPGARNGADKRYIRSDYCDKQDISSIVFDFSLNGKEYRVERTLPYNKINKKGAVAEETESALLYSLEKNKERDLFSDNEGLQLLESQKSKVDEKIENLLLLSIDEFTRIVLLPQGEFAAFLKQNSKERKGLLIKLFPIELFTKITEKIKDDKSKIAVSLQEVQIRIDELKKLFNPDSSQEEKLELIKEQKKAQKDIDSIQKKITNLLIEKEKLFEQEKKGRDFKLIEKELYLLQAQNNSIQELSEKLEHANEAEKIEPFANLFMQYSEEYEKGTKNLLECNENIQTLDLEQKTLLLKEDEHTKSITRLSLLEVLLHDLERALVLQKSVHENEENLIMHSQKVQECEQELTSIQDKSKDYYEIIENENVLQSTYNELELTQKKLSHELLLCEDAMLSFNEEHKGKAFENAKRILDTFIKESEKQKIAHIASSLLEHLEDGKACPVCGSLDHPNPTTQQAEILDISEKIRLQEQVVQQTEIILQNHKNERHKLSGSIEESSKLILGETPEYKEFTSCDTAKEHFEHIKKRIKETQNEIQESENNIKKLQEAKDAITVSQKIVETLQEKKHALQLQVTSIEAKSNENKKELTAILNKTEVENSLIQSRIMQLQTEKSELQKATQNFEKRKKENETNSRILKEKSLYLQETIKTAEKNKERVFLDLVDHIQSSKLFFNQTKTLTYENIVPLLEIIQKNLMDKNEKQLAKERVDTHNTETIRLTTLYNQLKEDVADGIEDIQKALESVQEAIDEHTKNQKESQNLLTQTQQRLSQLETLLSEYEITEKRRKDIEVDYDAYTKLHNIISGNNPKKVPLDSWILGMYLQEITIYANSRLKKMSNGRYELHLKQHAEGGNAYKGLDLEIYDDYTGKSRPSATLSGGETFLASISLALAISDMVQAQNGGVQLDSMFIDEGFGSLDPESLEKALGILDEIRETRSIALISHVETLQSRITSQIRVKKYSSGGSSIQIHNGL